MKQLENWWNEETISYYIHGKDNIPFHTIIWPAILMGIHQKTLPTHIISNDYLTLEKRANYQLVKIGLFGFRI